MKAYMIISEKRIHPFGDHPGESLITNRKLKDLQREVLKDLGFELRTISNAAEAQDPQEHIIFEDSLLFTKELLEEFIAKSRELNQCTVCALKPGLVTLRSIIATQDVPVYADRVEYGLWYFPPKGQPGKVMPIVIDPGEDNMAVPFPKHMFGTPGYQVAITDRFLIQIDHWVNLWSAGLLALLSQFARYKKSPPEFWADVMQKVGSMNQWDIMHQLNTIGQSCDIHPTAYVEGSTLGDNVTVGAGSVIRNSIVGDRTWVGNNSLLQACVVAEDCFVGNGVCIQVAVIYPNAVVNNRFTESSVYGRDTFVAEGVVLTDFRFDGKTVPVMKDGIMVDTGNPLVGTCIGHGVYLGAGCIVAPGRSIPNGLRLTPEPSRILRHVRPDGNIPGYRSIST